VKYCEYNFFARISEIPKPKIMEPRTYKLISKFEKIIKIMNEAIILAMMTNRKMVDSNLIFFGTNTIIVFFEPSNANDAAIFPIAKK